MNNKALNYTIKLPEKVLQVLILTIYSHVSRFDYFMTSRSKKIARANIFIVT